METALLFINMALGIILVIKGGDVFVDAASNIAKALKIPPFIIGATIVSIATTMPELIVSSVAAAQGKSDMAIGNAVGSVTANTAFIMALAFVFLDVRIERAKYAPQCLILLFSAIVLFVGSIQGTLSIVAVAILLGLYAASMFINIRNGRRESIAHTEEVIDRKGIFKDAGLFVVGAAMVVLGSQLMVDNGSELALLFGVSERVIGITLLAFGTSLPELVTTLTAIKKKQAHLSVGNIVGGNIIDIAFILPVSTAVAGKELDVVGNVLSVDIPVAIGVIALALGPLLIKGRATKLNGIVLIACYALYIITAVA